MWYGLLIFLLGGGECVKAGEGEEDGLSIIVNPSSFSRTSKITLSSSEEKD